jgi:glutathione S-transferase
MKLHSTNYAPNPRRVMMFIAEKGIADIEVVQVDIMKGEHKSEQFRAVNPLARVPALELDDGRVLCETRAICTYLEGLHPQPNLMGESFEERAFIEMADRRMELHLLQELVHWIWHTHPALAPLIQPQCPDYGLVQRDKAFETAHWIDRELAQREYIAGARFTVADITAFCALEFARGLLKFRPADHGWPRLQAWRDRIAERPAARAR